MAESSRRVELQAQGPRVFGGPWRTVGWKRGEDKEAQERPCIRSRSDKALGQEVAVGQRGADGAACARAWSARPNEKLSLHGASGHSRCTACGKRSDEQRKVGGARAQFAAKEWAKAV
eukprot:6181501-Pleurochrysis_carterae.AAC.1